MIWIEFDGHEDVVLIKDDVTVNGQYISNHGPWKGHLSFETIVCKAVTDAR